jgi:cystathionine beta-lyase/cystathionine gamma-synthase
VNYAGLDSHPHRARAARLFGGFGGMLSFELTGGAGAADRFLHRTTLPILAPSLGGPETLLTRPALTSHAGLTAEERQHAGITDGLIRMSVGLEAPEEILDDLKGALGTPEPLDAGIGRQR